jgi:hypothetical protein
VLLASFMANSRVGEVGVAAAMWSESGSATYPGRFPLSVERHVLNMADRLVPGITTVTLNARYYPLHGLVAAEAGKRGLDMPAARDLLRRAEVAIAAVSARHLQVDAAAHDALARPHGYDIIAPRVHEGSIDIAALAAPGVYARPAWGLWSAYRGPEAILQVMRADEFAPGSQFDQAAVDKGLEDLLAVADLGELDADLLDDCAHLCICQSAHSPDGAWLARLLAQPGLPDEPMTRAWTRRQTIRVLARSIERAEVRQASTDLSRFLAYDDAVLRDPVLGGTMVSALWRGLVLRNHSVGAWRDLWAWLAEQIDGLTPRAALGDRFAATLDGTQTVGGFVRDLPATRSPDGTPAPAELDPGLDESEWPVWCLSLLLLGARRSGELAGHELTGFQGDDPEDVFEELSPAWLAGQADAWRDRPVRDFARWLADVMVNRSQRLALRRATRDASTGVLKIPSRVYLRDGFFFRDGAEEGGAASLRVDQVAGVLAGAGLLTRSGGIWAIGPRGDLLA